VIVAIAGDRGRRRGSRVGGGGGDVEVANEARRCGGQAGADADMAADTGVADDGGLVGDVARRGAAIRQ
jgi:hypothetical protein